MSEFDEMAEYTAQFDAQEDCINEEEKEQALALLNYQPMVSQLNHLFQAVEEGFVNPLDANIALKHLEEAINRVRKGTMDKAIDEAMKYPEKEIEHWNAKVSIVGGRTTYSYKHIPEWEEATKKVKAIEAKAKQALEMAQKGDQYVTGDGEIVYPAEFKVGASSLRITLNK